MYRGVQTGRNDILPERHRLVASSRRSSSPFIDFALPVAFAERQDKLYRFAEVQGLRDPAMEWRGEQCEYILEDTALLFSYFTIVVSRVLRILSNVTGTLTIVQH
jgi:hypothetical protein